MHLGYLQSPYLAQWLDREADGVDVGSGYVRGRIELLGRVGPLELATGQGLQ